MPLFEVTDLDKKIYEEELKDFLPDRIFDVHTHVWLDSLIDRSDIPENNRAVTWPGRVALDNSVEDLADTDSMNLPAAQELYDYLHKPE